MKNLYVVFLAVLLILALFSCGLRLPSKAPEKVSVKYTKNFELPITTFNFKVGNLIENILTEIEGTPFKVLKEDPIKLKYATEVSYSPGNILDEVKEEIRNNLSDFSDEFSFELNTQSFLSQLSGTLSLPQIPTQAQESIIDISDIDINDLTLVNNIQISMGPNSSLLLSDLLTTLPFDEANFKEAKIELSFTGSSGWNFGVIIDGTEKPLNTTIPLFIKKTSTLILNNKTSNSVSGNITLKLRYLKLNYFKNLKVSDVITSGKISIDIPSRNISITSGDWYLKLAGNIKSTINIPGFSGTIKQTLNINSGSVNLGSGNANNQVLQVPINQVYFKVGNGIQVSGNVELSGIVSADFRTEKPKVRIEPNVSIKAVKNYEFTVNVPKPEIVQSITFTNDSGYMLVNFTGLTLTEATTTFGETIKDSNVKVSFKGVSLPNNVTVVLEGEITSENISYQAILPAGQTITIANAVVDSSLVAGMKVDINYPIPEFVKTIVNSLNANIEIKIKYKIKGINSIKVNISSNFFTENVGEVIFYDTNGEERVHTISGNQNIDFNTFNNFELKIEPSLASNIILSNVNLVQGAYVVFTPEISIFEISNVSLKEQSYQFNNLASIDLDQIFTQDLSFLKDFDYDISALVDFDITNSTIPAMVVLNISGNEIIVHKGQQVNIGDVIETLIKQGGVLEIDATIQTGTGILNQNSEIKFGINFTIPFSLTATDNDVLIKTGNVEGDLSVLKQVAEIVKNAQLKFQTWKNTTGVNVTLRLKKGSTEILSTNISTNSPSISLTRSQLQALSDGIISYEILVPKDQTLSVNYNGLIQMAPYIAVELDVATEVKLK